MLKRTLLMGVLLPVTVLLPDLAIAQDEQADGQEADVVIVFGKSSRLPPDITTVPGSVTIIDAAAIAAQSGISSDLGQILAKSTPGMSVSSNDGNNFAQTLRGRKPAFFIDGMPQSASLRGGGRDLHIIHPSVLQRVEVINGATSIYGLGGSGGVVNYITKTPGSEKLELFSEVGFATSLTDITDDSFEYTFSQGAAQKIGNVSFVANATFQKRGLYYDADGDPLPPDPYGQTGLADMEEVSLFGKVGIDLTNNANLEIMVLNYNADVETDYTVGQGSYATGVKSIAVRKSPNNIVVGPVAFDFLGEEDPSNRNFLTSVNFTLAEVMGSTVNFKGYYKDAALVWRHLDYLALAPSAGGFPPVGSQLTTLNEKYGAGILVTTPLQFGGADATILWGADYDVDKTEEKLVDGRSRTSELTQTGLSGFVQAQVDLTDWLHVRTGFRYDSFDLEIPDFMALDFFDANVLHTVVGADLDYNSWTGNFGAVVDMTDEFSVFASWSTGFSIGNVMRSIGSLRPSSPMAPQVYDVAGLGLFIEPVEVTSYEGGVRYVSDFFSGSVTGFLNKSDLGASFDPVTYATTRAPERIWGVEAVANINLTDWLRVGGTAALMDSKTDLNSDGAFDGPLDYTRVPPPIANYYLEVDYRDWTARIQATSLFSESRFMAPFASFQRDVEGYTSVDLLVSGKVGPGRLAIGVENVLNNNYTPLLTFMGCPTVTSLGSAFFDAFCNVSSVGARGSIKYSVSY